MFIVFLCLQWLGAVQSVNVIESGPGWINVYVVADNLDPAYYLLVDIRAVVDSGTLPSFAVTTEEKSFFDRNYVSMLSNATFGVSASGYDSANYLLSKFQIYILV